MFKTVFEIAYLSACNFQNKLKNNFKSNRQNCFRKMLIFFENGTSFLVKKFSKSYSPPNLKVLRFIFDIINIMCWRKMLTNSCLNYSMCFFSLIFLNLRSVRLLSSARGDWPAINNN